jgi:hypothetical protein
MAHGLPPSLSNMKNILIRIQPHAGVLYHLALAMPSSAPDLLALLTQLLLQPQLQGGTKVGAPEPAAELAAAAPEPVSKRAKRSALAWEDGAAAGRMGSGRVISLPTEGAPLVPLYHWLYSRVHGRSAAAASQAAQGQQRSEPAHLKPPQQAGPVRGKRAREAAGDGSGQAGLSFEVSAPEALHDDPQVSFKSCYPHRSGAALTDPYQSLHLHCLTQEVITTARRALRQLCLLLRHEQQPGAAAGIAGRTGGFAPACAATLADLLRLQVSQARWVTSVLAARRPALS